MTAYTGNGWAVGVVKVCRVNLFSGNVASPKPNNHWQTWVINLRHLKMLNLSLWILILLVSYLVFEH